ncbi:hypothetical protein ACE3MQ_12085 [Paenibacillus lentus]|uniref:hypothetical protein n=1 Tax=Paenibacillus lentus TaxID=1338368 RepID=UPI003664038E
MSEQLLREILQKVSNIEIEQGSMKSDMQTMKSEMKIMQSDMKTIKSEMQTMKADVQSVKGTQELMQTQLNETNAIVRAIRDRQDETDAKLDALSMDVHKLRGDFVRLQEGQERHEKVLEKLSLRSIEQETDISALRRAK